MLKFNLSDLRLCMSDDLLDDALFIRVNWNRLELELNIIGQLLAWFYFDLNQIIFIHLFN